MIRVFPMLLLAGLFAGCASVDQAPPQKAETTVSLADFQQQAKRYHETISLPQFETTPEAIRQSSSNAIARANAALDKIGALNHSKVTFANTICALDGIMYQAWLTANRVLLIKDTSTNAAVRDAATDQFKILEEWTV